MTARQLVRLVSVVVLVLTLGLLQGCGGSSAPASGGTSAGDPDASYAAIIDVRTPAEFAEGHVAGAINLDVSAADFAGKVAELSSSGTYLVYCRSGNRSAAAAATMREAGLTVIDGGGLEDMRTAGFGFGA